MPNVGNAAAEVSDATATASSARNPARIRAWGSQLRQKSLRVPKKPGGGIAYATIAKEIEVKLSVFQAAGASRRIVDELVEELGTMPHNDYLEKRYGAAARKDGATRNYGDQAALALGEHLRALEAKRGFVPEGVHAVGTPSYDKVLKAAGIRYPSGKYAYAADRLFRLVDETAGRLGLGPERHRPVRGANGGTLTYEAAAKLAVGASGNGQATTTMARRMSCLNKIREHVGKEPADLIGSEFGSGFERMLEELAATFHNPDTRRHFLANTRAWRELIRPHVIATELPPRLSDALAALMRERGVPNATRLAEIAGLEASTMQNWIRGTCEPQRVESPALSKLETHFELAPGTLTSRVSMMLGTTEMREEGWPPCLRKSNLRRIVRPYLPEDFARLPIDEREAIGQRLLRSSTSNIAYRVALSETKPWRLKGFPPMLSEQWEAFVDYKTGMTSGQLKRNERWKSIGTRKRSFTQYNTFFSSLILPKADSGLGLAECDLTFGCLVSPSLIEWHIEWLRARADEVQHTGIRTFLGEVCSVLRPETGYLGQMPALARSLTPIPRHLSAEEIERWKSDPAAWTTACNDAHARLYDLMKKLEVDFDYRRDPFAPIQPILDAKRPLDYLESLLAQAFEDLLPKSAGKGVPRALALRDFLLYATLVETALRLKNLTSLDYRNDGKGRLRKEGGRYVVVIEAKEFKNAESSFFNQGFKRRRKRTSTVARSSYRRELPDHLTPLFDEYFEPVTGERALLRALKKGPDTKADNAVWVSRFGGAGSSETVSAVCYRLTKRYLAYNEAANVGVPGVEPFGAHAVRHIGATHIIKVTGSIAAAAAHLQDAEHTVAETYVRYLPADKTALAVRMLQEGRQLPPWAAK